MFAIEVIMYYFCKLMAGIYIHIPFCEKRCIYCDFYSTTDNRLAEKYIDCLVTELNNRICELGNEKISTIYIGGGTPSQLSVGQLSRLVESIAEMADFSKIEEFTIEVNPDDVTLDYMGKCKALGINRISMGVQSFVDSELKAINRRHTAGQAKDAIDMIKSVGFENISIDLIYGLPQQTIESWKYSINNAVALAIPHISCYNLSYEEGTVLYRMREKGEIQECDEDDCIRMYDILVAELTRAGYEHYEISNFSKPGLYSRHNSNYWNYTPYLGLGAAAHSFDGRLRRYNPSSIMDYIKKVESNGTAYENEQETDWERYNEYVMMNLRTMWGLRTEQIRERFGEVLYNHLIIYSRRFVSNGELRECNGNLSLTEKGIMLSDYIIRTLMYLPE